MPFMDRESFIDLLNRLGDGDDQVVLAAARTIHARVAESRFGWDGLLLPAGGSSDEPAPPDASTPRPVLPTLPVAEEEPDADLIDRLLRDYDLSDMTRGDLLEMKAQADQGSLLPDDSKYLRDLAARLALAEP
ncbi:hypothetical protein GE253_01175 [Niveispirillum sp. SYP-B3756]|uniref:hypothetical protein n=1 Tax=Niveispirillum sp. SYP-B3756 TaxID=2662178 RepID=UPI0012914235|nr:hypothetical protein [Niveispirillum sp. SYP-B3756]MQP63948.1 hypothetical protein [Niveispirillum sp. SYP-B3756]